MLNFDTHTFLSFFFSVGGPFEDLAPKSHYSRDLLAGRQLKADSEQLLHHGSITKLNMNYLPVNILFDIDLRRFKSSPACAIEIRSL